MLPVSLLWPHTCHTLSFYCRWTISHQKMQATQKRSSLFIISLHFFFKQPTRIIYAIMHIFMHQKGMYHIMGPGRLLLLGCESRGLHLISIFSVFCEFFSIFDLFSLNLERVIKCTYIIIKTNSRKYKFFLKVDDNK